MIGFVTFPVFISGQVALDEGAELVGKLGLRAQTGQSPRNMAKVRTSRSRRKPR